MKRVALGFRAHSGWAAYVAMAGPGNLPQIVARGRIELCDPRIPPPFQPYHKAAEMPFKKAEEYIRRVTEQTEHYAREAIERTITDLQARGMRLTACAVLLGSGRMLVAAASRRHFGEVNSPLRPLEKILAAHPLIHTAEGVLFREAILGAAERCGLKATGIVERDLFTRAESDLQLSQKEIELCLAEFGRALGPPWQQDQKFSTLAAWLAL